MKRSALILFNVFMVPFYLYAQSVYLPATHQVYTYLDKMEAKQIILGYRDEMKPLTRESIAEFLIQIDTTSMTMTDIEMEEQFFYKEEFYQELVNLGYENVIEERWHLYQYIGNPGKFNFDLVGGFSYHERPDKKNTKITSNGLNAYGYIGDKTGAYFNFRDNHESGSFVDPVISVPPASAGVIIRKYSPIPAEVVSRNFFPRFVEYDQIDAQLNVDLSFATISVEKMHNVWGAGERGNIILSNKAPSFPQIKLRAPLGENIDFVYIHGWLHSNMNDSIRSYNVNDFGSPLTRIIYKQKFIAAHMLEFTPWDGVDIAIGESEIYGGRNPEMLYLVPFMFFKAAEHWMYDTDNSQMFLSVDLNVVRGYNFYFSVFIDEFSTEDFARSDRQRNQLAFTAGTRAYDLFLPDTKILVEYTRLNPWVYNHKYPDATFQSHSADLGHWLGQNGDMIFIQVMYQPMRKLTLGVQLESVRKGSMLPTINQYRLPTPSFLYSPLTKFQSYGIVGRYEIVRDAAIDLQLLRSRYSSEVNSGKTDYSGRLDAFLGIRYNFD